MHTQPLKRCTECGGFTLLEVLLASTILAIIMVLLLLLGHNALRLWNHDEQRRQSLGEARAALQIISDDLHAAVITKNPASFMLITNTEASQPVIDRLFFLVSHNDDHGDESGIKNLCATGYFLTSAPQEHGVKNLYRFHASGMQVSMAIKKNHLEDLYALASLKNGSFTEILLHHVIEFSVTKLFSEHSIPPKALMINLSTIDWKAGYPIIRQGETSERGDHLMNHFLQRYNIIVHLPPPRESSQ